MDASTAKSLEKYGKELMEVRQRVVASTAKGFVGGLNPLDPARRLSRFHLMLGYVSPDARPVSRHKERKSLAKYIREDALLGDFFEVFLFEEAPARNRSAQAVYLDEVEKRHGSDHRQVYRTRPRASRVRSDVRLFQDNHLAHRKRRRKGASRRG